MAGLSWARVSRGALAALLIGPVAACARGGSTTKSDGPKTKPIVAAVDVRVPIAPTAFRADGKWHVVYELHLNNMDRWPYRLTKVEAVSADSTSRSLVVYTGAGLDSAVARPGQPAIAEKTAVGPGSMAVVYMWATVASADALPKAIRHRLTFKIGTYPEEMTLETGPTPVGRGVVTIGPPLRGDHWLAANGPSNSSAHRRALIPIDGHATIAQRMAIDHSQQWPAGHGRQHPGHPGRDVRLALGFR